DRFKVNSISVILTLKNRSRHEFGHNSPQMSIRRPGISGLEERFGWAARWVVQAVLNRLAADLSLSRAARQYLSSLLLSEDLADALRGAKAPRREVESSIDSLLRQSRAYAPASHSTNGPNSFSPRLAN